ncbi:MAG: ParA family protein [Pseudomonadota bacterium]
MAKLIKLRGLTYKKTIATIGMEKGGIGKSLLTINVAMRKAQTGAKVLIIDLDPEACATNFLIPDAAANSGSFVTMLEIFKDRRLTFSDAAIPTGIGGLDIVPCKGKARRVDKFIRDDNLSNLMHKRLGDLSRYDLVLFEVPPTFTNIISMAYMASDLIVMPTFPDAWSLESILLTIEDVTEACHEWATKIPEMKILLNKYNPTRRASVDAWGVLTRDFGDKVLPFQIPERADIQNSINEGKSVWEIGSPKVVKDALDQLAHYILPLESLNNLVSNEITQ